MSTAKIRGRLGILYHITIVIGTWLCNVVGLKLDDRLAEDWRWISIICASAPLFLAIAMIFVPETPYWLLKTGLFIFGGFEFCLIRLLTRSTPRSCQIAKMESWRRIRYWIWVDSIGSFDQSTKYHCYALWFVRLVGSETVSSVLGGFTVPSNLWNQHHPLLHGRNLWRCRKWASTFDEFLHLQFRQSNYEVNFTMFFKLKHFEQVVIAMLAVVLVDRTGRRFLMLTSSIMSTIGMFALGAYYYLDEHSAEIAKSFTWLPLTSMIIFIAGFALGLGPLPWLIMSEILPREIKGFNLSNQK